MGAPSQKSLITAAFQRFISQKPAPKQKPLSAEQKKITDAFETSYQKNGFSISEALTHAFWAISSQSLNPAFLAQAIPAGKTVKLDITDTNARGASLFLEKVGTLLQAHPQVFQSVTLELQGVTAAELTPAATHALLDAVRNGAKIDGNVLTEAQLLAVESKETTRLLKATS